MSKAKAKATAEGSKLTVRQDHGDSDADAMAKAFLRPTIQSALTAFDLLKSQSAPVELDSLIQELGKQVKAAQQGDLSRTEAMMTTQAHTLDLLFTALTRRAIGNMGKYPETVERYMKLALRAQAQCRATAETLHEMKYPKPVSFVQQANIANGPQQVNNGQASSGDVTRTEENRKEPNELLEHNDGERLDFGTQGAAGRAHPPMAAMETGDRANNACG